MSNIPKTITLESSWPVIIDQTALPHRLDRITIKSMAAMYDAIQGMKIRGAPAIGVAGAAGMALFISQEMTGEGVCHADLDRAKAYLDSARPTAVNLSWGTEQVKNFASAFDDLALLADMVWSFVESLISTDEACNRAIGVNGADAINRPVSVLTHCNAGSLATVYWGTALGVVRELHARGLLKHVWIDETRPRLQGGKLTAWECMQEGIPATVIADNMAAHVMAAGEVDVVITGADRIARNGDSANKIGTYGLAVNAQYHQVPFYVAAPISTIDVNTPSGQEIEIEHRDNDELAEVEGQRVYPVGCEVFNPAFDVTPSALITGGIVTERAVWKPSDQKELASSIM